MVRDAALHFDVDCFVEKNVTRLNFGRKVISREMQNGVLNAVYK